MAHHQQEIKSVKLDCEECGAEVVITTLYAPPFRDPSPLCPYCQFPMTAGLTPEEVVASLRATANRLQSEIAEVAA